jgi:hypothetical protein
MVGLVSFTDEPCHGKRGDVTGNPEHKKGLQEEPVIGRKHPSSTLQEVACLSPPQLTEAQRRRQEIPVNKGSSPN